MENEITDKLTEIFRNIFEDDKIELNEVYQQKMLTIGIL